MPVAASLTSSTLSTHIMNSTSESTSITMYTRPTMQSTGTIHHMSSGIIGGITAGVVLLLSLLVVVAPLIIRRRTRRGITTGVSDETIARPYDMAGGDIEKSGNATGSDAALHPSTFPSVTIAPQAKREHHHQQSNPILNDQLTAEVTTLPGLVERLNRAIRLLESRPGISTNVEEQPPRYEE
ncbi:hypothetical protein BC629DRAFT_1549289 [Irpex lacteus]|nr:hypothetical protein BC629DRAFT_1549289 [Irpex lacteus]